MQTLRSIADLASLSGPVVLAAGTFDGLHLGHQALIGRAIREAALIGGTAVVMTFDRHPASITRPDKTPKLLTRNATKLALLEQIGVPVVLLLEFNEKLAAIPAEEFIRSLCEAANPLHKICVGSQWSFGRGGAGNITLLKKLGGELGFSVESIPPVDVDGSAISSTRIREAIATGDFQAAAQCLGRSYLLSGNVVAGMGLGGTIGFPTANLDVQGMQLPPEGVYAVLVHFDGNVQPGVANLGVRPTVDYSTDPKRTLEVHLFDFSEDLVGKELALEFVHFLRGEQKFSGLEELKAQISHDCEQARAVLLEKMVKSSVYTSARNLIDTAHASDVSLSPDGRPAELVYADHIESWVQKLVPDASPLLLLAARCQHLERWIVPRKSFPEGKAGYLAWRKSLYVKQADRAGELLMQAGVSAEEIEEAKTWISKSGLKINAGTQALEDAAVLVFLEKEIDAFAEQHGEYPREKFVDILRKSWRKLSPQAQEVAKGLQLSPAIASLVQEALAG